MTCLEIVPGKAYTLLGDARAGLARMGDGRVQTVVTSPPYFGLRDYGVEGQIGAGQSFDDYVQDLLEVFREVRRVLRDDGTLWLVIGDSYVGSPGSAQGRNGMMYKRKVSRQAVRGGVNGALGLPQKSLVGAPWRVALALQEDGWILRQDIVWSKQNVMPNPNVRDRCLTSHEYVFLFSKSPRYLFDQAALAEPAKWNPEPGKTRQPWSVWSLPTQPFHGDHFAAFPPRLVERCILAGSRPGDLVLDPFMGSGTVHEVALRLGRKSAGCELNPDYVTLQYGRALKVALKAPGVTPIEELVGHTRALAFGLGRLKAMGEAQLAKKIAARAR